MRDCPSAVSITAHLKKVREGALLFLILLSSPSLPSISLVAKMSVFLPPEPNFTAFVENAEKSEYPK